jgi:hypothetical protein
MRPRWPSGQKSCTFGLKRLYKSGIGSDLISKKYPNLTYIDGTEYMRRHLVCAAAGILLPQKQLLGANSK